MQALEGVISHRADDPATQALHNCQLNLFHFRRPVVHVLDGLSYPNLDNVHSRLRGPTAQDIRDWPA